jgi:hypothetical protein
MKYGQEKSLDSMVHVVVVNGMIMNPQTRMIDEIMYISPLLMYNYGIIPI